MIKRNKLRNIKDLYYTARTVTEDSLRNSVELEIRFHQNFQMASPADSGDITNVLETLQVSDKMLRFPE